MAPVYNSFDMPWHQCPNYFSAEIGCDYIWQQMNLSSMILNWQRLLCCMTTASWIMALLSLLCRWVGCSEKARQGSSRPKWGRLLGFHSWIVLGKYWSQQCGCPKSSKQRHSIMVKCLLTFWFWHVMYVVFRTAMIPDDPSLFRDQCVQYVPTGSMANQFTRRTVHRVYPKTETVSLAASNDVSTL